MTPDWGGGGWLGVYQLLSQALQYVPVNVSPMSNLRVAQKVWSLGFEACTKVEFSAINNQRCNRSVVQRPMYNNCLPWQTKCSTVKLFVYTCFCMPKNLSRIYVH